MTTGSNLEAAPATGQFRVVFSNTHDPYRLITAPQVDPATRTWLSQVDGFVLNTTQMDDSLFGEHQTVLTSNNTHAEEFQRASKYGLTTTLTLSPTRQANVNHGFFELPEIEHIEEIFQRKNYLTAIKYKPRFGNVLYIRDEMGITFAIGFGPTQEEYEEERFKLVDDLWMNGDVEAGDGLADEFEKGRYANQSIWLAITDEASIEHPDNAVNEISICFDRQFSTECCQYKHFYQCAVEAMYQAQGQPVPDKAVYLSTKGIMDDIEKKTAIVRKSHLLASILDGNITNDDLRIALQIDLTIVEAIINDVVRDKERIQTYLTSKLQDALHNKIFTKRLDPVTIEEIIHALWAIGLQVQDYGDISIITANVFRALERRNYTAMEMKSPLHRKIDEEWIRNLMKYGVDCGGHITTDAPIEITPQADTDQQTINDGLAAFRSWFDGRYGNPRNN